MSKQAAAKLSEDEVTESTDTSEIVGTREIGDAELKSIAEALIFVADEPLSAKTIADVLKVDLAAVEKAISEFDLVAASVLSGNRNFEARVHQNIKANFLMSPPLVVAFALAGRIDRDLSKAEHHEQVRAYLKSKPSAKLSLASLETLAVIAYKQPVTVPEILEIRGVQSPSAIKTLLDKRLIVARGRKETVGRPMMYGTSKEFLIQFGLKDLTELPSIEDFQDLAGGEQ